VSLRLTSWVVMESPKGLSGGWFKPLWFDKSLLILNGNFNKNYFSGLVIQYVTLFDLDHYFKCCMVKQECKINVTVVLGNGKVTNVRVG
jgi:hypothetical protein